jgi:hypothetical protein
MTERLSFTRFENVIYPGFRQKVQKAETIVDVRNSFTLAMRELLRSAFEGKLSFEDDDIKLLPESDSRFAVSKRLLSSGKFKTIWDGSDLPRVVERFADVAVGRWKRIQKHPEKTDSKIRM